MRPGKKDERICVAQIGAAHGLKGEVRLWSYTEEPAAVARYGALTIEDGSRQIEIVQLRAEKDHFIARLRGIDDRNAAEALRNTRLYVARERLPAPDDADTFYHADLIGLAAVYPDGNALGEVVAIHNYGAGDIVEIRLADGSTQMFPFHQAVVPQIDIAAGRMTIVPPEEIEGEDTNSESPPPLRGRSAAKRPGGR